MLTGARARSVVASRRKLAAEGGAIFDDLETSSLSEVSKSTEITT